MGNDNDTNRDLDKYRGYFDLKLMVAKKGGFSLATHYQHGIKGWSVLTDFNYPLPKLLMSNIALYFMVQRFDGYAESLIDFREKRHVTRIGFSIIR